jgi:hypothetical protein
VARDRSGNHPRFFEPGPGESVELARSLGTQVKRKPEEIYDNFFVIAWKKTGFLKNSGAAAKVESLNEVFKAKRTQLSRYRTRS